MADRSRKWLLTIFFNDIVNESFDFFSVLKYDVVIVSPVHNEPNKHYHIIVQHNNAISFNTLKNIFNFAHIEKQFGSNQQAYDYLFHKNDENKEELKEEDIKSNIDITSWLNGDSLSKEDLAKNLFDTIENSRHLWQVIRKFPTLWRDVSKIKDLWHIYKVYKFEIDNPTVKDADGEVLRIERLQELSPDEFFSSLGLELDKTQENT